VADVVSVPWYYPQMPKTIEQRFWSKVDKNGPVHPVLKTRCWIWTGNRGSYGYGRIREKRGAVHAKRSAHRVAWELVHGPIPPKMEVCHHCDNPPCVRADGHLFLGTHAENVRDMVKKKRHGFAVSPAKHVRGERVVGAKLSSLTVGNLRADTDLSLQQLAQKYGISKSQAHRVRNGRSWRHVCT
jgi:hypothetical protein